MKKSLFFYVLMCIFYLNLSLLNAQTVEVVFAFEDQHNFPFYMYSGKQVIWKKPGISVEVLKLLEKYIDIKVNFLRMPWNDCKAKLKTGEVDGIFNASFKKKRLKLGQYPMIKDMPNTSQRITTINYCLYVLKDSNIKFDAKKKKLLNVNGPIAAPTGYSICDDLRKMGVKVDEQAPNTKITFNKMIYGTKVKNVTNKLAGVAALELAGDFFLQKFKVKEFRDIKKISPPLVEKPYYLMLSHQFVKKYPEMAKKIWETISIIREKEMSSIIDKYFED